MSQPELPEPATQDYRPTPTSLSVTRIAILQGLASAFAVVVAGLLFRSQLQAYLQWEDAVRRHNPIIDPDYHWPIADLFVGVILPVAFAILGLVSSFGLIARREWARKTAIALSIVPVLGCAMLILLRPPFLFPLDATKGTILAAVGGIAMILFLGVLAVLAPISIWSLLVMTRPTVRSYFGRTDFQIPRPIDHRSDRLRVALFLWITFLVSALLVGLSHL